MAKFRMPTKAGAMRSGWNAMKTAASAGRRVSGAVTRGVTRARNRVKALTGKGNRKFTDLSKLPAMSGMDVGERTQKAAGAARTIQKFARRNQAKAEGRKILEPMRKEQAAARQASEAKNKANMAAAEAEARKIPTPKQMREAEESGAFANVAQGLKKATAGRQTSRADAMKEAKHYQDIENVAKKHANVIGEMKMVQSMRKEEAAANTIGRLGRRAADRAAGKRTIAKMRSDAKTAAAAKADTSLPINPFKRRRGGGVREGLSSAAGKVAAAGRSAANKWANTDKYTKLILATTAAGAIGKIAQNEENEKRRKAEDDARRRAASYV